MLLEKKKSGGNCNFFWFDFSISPNIVQRYNNWPLVLGIDNAGQSHSITRWVRKEKGGHSSFTMWTHAWPTANFTNFLMHRKHIVGLKSGTHRNLRSPCFFPCKIPIPYDALYAYDACNVLVKSYSKSIIATTHSNNLRICCFQENGP